MSEENIGEGDIENLAADEEGESPFAKLEGELEKLRNEVLYAQAETQNVRRRLEKEKAERDKEIKAALAEEAEAQRQQEEARQQEKAQQEAEG